MGCLEESLPPPKGPLMRPVFLPRFVRPRWRLRSRFRVITVTGEGALSLGVGLRGGGGAWHAFSPETKGSPDPCKLGSMKSALKQRCRIGDRRGGVG